MVTIPDAAIGAVAAALIAGIVSLLGLIISKEQKTSEFRHAWIEALRADLSAFLTQINAIHDANNVKYDDLANKVETLRPLYLPLNTSTFNILLRVNPNEANSQRLLAAMEAFNALTIDQRKLTTENIRPIEAELIAAAQILLKFEWRRVKSGEQTFRIAKLLALIVILTSILSGGVVGYRAWHLQSHAAPQVTAPQPRPAAAADLTSSGTGDRPLMNKGVQ